MKLVFRSKDGTVYQISSLFIYSNLQIAAYWKVDGGLQSAYVPDDGMPCQSTGMFDKNGKEILVGDRVNIKGIISEIIFDGTEFWCHSALGDFDILTPELAATLEVVS